MRASDAQATHDVRLLRLVLGLVDLALLQPQLQQEQVISDPVLVVELPLREVLDLAEDKAESRKRQRDRRCQQLQQHQELTADRSSLRRILTKLYGGQGPLKLNRSRPS